MKIAITGSTGLLGSALVEYFKKQNHDIIRLIRPETKFQGDEQTLVFDVKAKQIDASVLEGCDVVINLAGANIAGQRWSAAYKEQLRNSRIETTQFLAETLSKLKQKPKVLLSASAVGYYGLADEQTSFDENSEAGEDFLAQLCVEWEQATKGAEEAGIRVVCMRIGVVLSTKDAALAKMLPVFKLGLGGKIGDGQQMFSWIPLDEIPLMISHIIENENIKGPINFVSPQPVNNAEFTSTLGAVIKRPTVLPLPAFVVNLLLGEMGKTLLLGGAKVLPKRFEQSNYHFEYPDLKSALTHCLN